MLALYIREPCGRSIRPSRKGLDTHGINYRRQPLTRAQFAMRTRRADTRLKHGPYRQGDRAFLSNYPPDYALSLLDGPRLFRTGTVVMCGPYQTWMRFDDGEQLVVRTQALNKGEPE